LLARSRACCTGDSFLRDLSGDGVFGSARAAGKLGARVAESGGVDESGTGERTRAEGSGRFVGKPAGFGATLSASDVVGAEAVAAAGAKVLASGLLASALLALALLAEGRSTPILLRALFTNEVRFRGRPRPVATGAAPPPRPGRCSPNLGEGPRSVR